MPISEAARSDLYNGLSDVIGPERTETLMSAIAWHTIDEVATKGDLAELRADMASIGAELRTEIAQLRAELKADMASLETTLTKRMASWMVTILVAVIGAMISIAFLV